ncbi:MAG TPA: helix-turn-helix transcriptional regulator [Micromonosporaceae bacterium]|nr:helix-turn-helix transcriptional regulator [Micromonosporaceae bacterium]
MSGNRRYSPNRLLAWERLQRGWSYEELTCQIRQSMTSACETDTGLSANTVRRWETGERWPEPRYRKHLVLIFNRPASELGLLTPEELQQRPDRDLAADCRGLLDVANADGGIDRAAVLRGILGLAALPGITPLLSLGSSNEPANTDSATSADAYFQVTRQHRELYWACPPRTLFEPVYTHAQLGVSLLRNAAGTPRATIATALAETALLAGRLAFFDLNQPALTHRCYDVALAASREAGDHALAAAVLGHMAFIPAFSRDPHGARDLLAAARQHTWHGVGPAVRSWLHCVASEVAARDGAGAAARHEIALAESAFAQDATTPEWMDYYNAGRLNAFAGYAALADGAATEAAERLRQCLDALGERDAKQRSVVLADLAEAHCDDPDQVAAYLDRALDAVERNWYSTGLDRVRSTRAVLADSLHGAALDERIAALVSTSRQAISG